ncbi:MAG: holo-[acyl-carrier-protein] synthase [Anaerocolumna sp.]|nr:holo-[acyl-carrier-protein] synthase [Anaerocolumna sp.]
MDIGVDIVEIKHVSNLCKYNSQLHKVFTQLELDSVNNLSENKRIQYLAEKFAAKEAFSKAIGTGFTREVQPNHIEVLYDEGGAPRIQVYHSTKGSIELIKVKQIHVSLTHSYTHACATVIIT